MIKTLKRKIVMCIMLIIGSFTIFSALGISYYATNKHSRDLFISMETMIKEPTTSEVDDGGGEEKEEDAQFSLKCCIINVNSDNEYVIKRNDIKLEDSDLKNIVQDIIKNNRRSGATDSPELFFSTNKLKDDTTNIIFISQSYLSDYAFGVNMTAFLFSFSFLLVIFFISLLVANVVAKPVEQALKQQKTFIADASHELKTPLAVISANTKIVEKTANEEQKEWIESTNDEIKHMSEIITEMLTLAQTENLSKASKTEINLSKLATSLCLQFEPIAFDKQIELETNIEDEVVVNFNEKMLRQLVMILLDNAIKHEESHGNVILQVEKKNNQAYLKVTNKKSYIPKEKLSHIFERFYKVDESRSTQGFGLGLAIAKNLAKLNDSTILVQSSKEEGTTFEIKFPALHKYPKQ